jgi:hypothetical protein
LITTALRTAWATYRRHFGLFLALGAVYPLFFQMNGIFQLGAVAELLLSLAAMAILAVVSLAQLSVVKQIRQNKHPSLQAAVADGYGNLNRYVLVMLQTMLIFSVAAFFLLLPAFYAYLVLLFAVDVPLLEDDKSYNPLRVSRLVTRGHLLTVLGALLLMQVPVLAVSALALALVHSDTVAVRAAAVLGAALYMPFVTVFRAELYYRLRDAHRDAVAEAWMRGGWRPGFLLTLFLSILAAVLVVAALIFGIGALADTGTGHLLKDLFNEHVLPLIKAMPGPARQLGSLSARLNPA